MHQLGVADLIAALALVSAEPQEIVVLGVAAGLYRLGHVLSPAVESALAALWTRLCLS